MKLNKSYKYLIIVLVLLSLVGCSTQRKLRKADMRYEVGEYNKAAMMYYRAIRGVKTKNERAEVSFKMAECFRLTNNIGKASSSYRTAVRYKYNNPIVYLNYANVLYEQNNIKEAKKHYKLYLEVDSANTQAKNGIMACDSLSKWNLNLKTRHKVAIAKQFESRRSSNFAPSVAGDDENTVYFTTSRDGVVGGKETSSITGMRNNDIFVVTKDLSEKWKTPELVEAVNTVFDEGVPTFTADGRSMYFTRAEHEEGKNKGTSLWLSQRKGSEWSDPERLVLIKDSLADTLTFAHPAPNTTGLQLVFASDLPGGYGGIDLWMVKKEGEDWSKPINLGSSINTSGNEMFPYYRDDTTLYFSSDGLPSFGGLDIFCAVSKSDTLWEVANVGIPINSKNDDFGITFFKDKEQGYFSSNRKDSKGYDHVYSFVLPILEYKFEGLVIDEKTNAPVAGATIKLVGNDGTNVKIVSKKDGTYTYPLTKEVEYVYLATAQGYLNQSGEMNTLNAEQSIVHQRKFKLASIRQSIRLSNIFFDFASAELTSASHASLDSLIKTLSDNPNITVEISAHSDAIGEDDVNLKMSQKRAESVVQYLIKNGVASDRLTPEGYGETKPVIVEQYLADQHKFMAVGDTLNESFVKKLNDKEKEIVYSINRRTEFKVLSTTYQAKAK